MALEQEFKDAFTQTLRVYKYEGTNDYGQDAYDTDAVNIPCHINARVTEMLSEAGETRLSTGVAYIDIVPWLTADDNAYVPETSSHQSSSNPGFRQIDIIGVQTAYDEDGPHHMVVYFGER